MGKLWPKVYGHGREAGQVALQLDTHRSWICEHFVELGGLRSKHDLVRIDAEAVREDDGEVTKYAVGGQPTCAGRQQELASRLASRCIE